MSECPDCTRAAREVWGGFSARCKGCEARAVARSPVFHEARLAREETEAYLDMLQKVGVTHLQVKAAWMADAMRKGAR